MGINGETNTANKISLFPYLLHLAQVIPPPLEECGSLPAPAAARDTLDDDRLLDLHAP